MPHGPDGHQVNLSRGLPETRLDPEAAAVTAALATALATTDKPPGVRRDAVAAVVAAHPGFLDGWAQLGALARDPVEAYAYYRAGYHRGLDQLRKSGWRGSGYVRWSHEPNRGFLRSLDGLRVSAAAIGEADETQRCMEFLLQCDPDWESRRD